MSFSGGLVLRASLLIELFGQRLALRVMLVFFFWFSAEEAEDYGAVSGVCVGKTGSGPPAPCCTWRGRPDAQTEQKGKTVSGLKTGPLTLSSLAVASGRTTRPLSFLPLTSWLGHSGCGCVCVCVCVCVRLYN